LRFALDAAAKPLPAFEIAALVAGGAGKSLRHAGDTAAEPIDTIEVAAVDGGGAGKTFGRADLLGFAEAILAQQISAAGLIGRARIAKVAARGGIVVAEDVELAGTRTAGSESKHEGRDKRGDKGHANGT